VPFKVANVQVNAFFGWFDVCYNGQWFLSIEIVASEKRECRAVGATGYTKKRSLTCGFVYPGYR